MENNIIDVREVSKQYPSGLHALKNINLQIKRGEIFALLGPNGAGKTTLISMICGIVNVDAGSVRVGGYDVVKQYRQARQQIGLVPQELAIDVFAFVWDTMVFSRGLFGKPRNDAYLEEILKALSLWDGFYPDFADTSKKPDNGQKECLCQREENTVQSSNRVLLNKPDSPVLVVLRLLKNWALPQTC